MHETKTPEVRAHGSKPILGSYIPKKEKKKTKREAEKKKKKEGDTRAKQKREKGQKPVERPGASENRQVKGKIRQKWDGEKESKSER